MSSEVYSVFFQYGNDTSSNEESLISQIFHSPLSLTRWASTISPLIFLFIILILLLVIIMLVCCQFCRNSKPTTNLVPVIIAQSPPLSPLPSFANYGTSERRSCRIKTNPRVAPPKSAINFISQLSPPDEYNYDGVCVDY